MLLPNQDLHNPGQYRRLIVKLNYLTITKPEITFAICVISQFLSALKTSH